MSDLSVRPSVVTSRLPEERQKTRLKDLKSRLAWLSRREKRTVCIQLLVSLSLLLSLQFPLYYHLPLFITIHSITCANHSRPCPQPLSMFSWAYL